MFARRNRNLEAAQKVAANLQVPWDEVKYWAAFKTPSTGAFMKAALLITGDRIIYGHEQLALAGAKAMVDTSGNTAIAQGWVVKERTDTRQLFLTVESDSTLVIQFVPEHEATARKIAAYINGAAKPAVSPTLRPEVDIPDQIRKLAELKEQGVLTTAEFEAKKAELLSKL